MVCANDKLGEEHGYMYSRALAKYLEEKLHLLKHEHELKYAGKGLSEEVKLKKRRNDRMKVHILNKHIFESMANIIYFLEYVAKYNELHEVFEDDIEQLFFSRNISDDINANRSQAFRRLIDAATTWDIYKDPNNFRAVLFNVMQRIITMHLAGLFHTTRKEFDETTAGTLIGHDMGRAYAWTNLYAKMVEERRNPITRPLLF